MSLRAILAAASLVVLGAALGVTADRVWLAHHQHEPRVVLDGGHGARFHALLDSLNLTESQRVAVDSVLRHFQGNVDQTWTTLRPRLEPTIDSARRAIEAVFDDEQLAAFRTWLAVEQERMHGLDHGFPH
jgi:hypothetical protein